MFPIPDPVIYARALLDLIKGPGIGNASRERIVITELNLTMLVTGLLIISSLLEGKEVGFSSY